VSGVTFTQVIVEILKDALRRSVFMPAPGKKAKTRNLKLRITAK
jgi:hypothetical protein